MLTDLRQAFWQNFLGSAPIWYKKTILALLLINPLIFLVAGGFVAGWVLVAEFIMTLAMALRCYPLQPGGLLALEALLIGMADTATVRQEVFANFPVILLLMFMVAGVFFMNDLLLLIFTKLLVRIKSRMLVAVLFTFSSAVLSAFLDALTLIAVVISAGIGFYTVYHAVASGKVLGDPAHDITDDLGINAENQEDLKKFRAFLRGLLMHAAVGTALGGVCTTVGEPQNLLIANVAGWNFQEFYLQMAPVTMPVFFAGLATCLLLERFRLFGYGRELPPRIRTALEAYEARQSEERTAQMTATLYVQGLAAILLMLALGFHVAEVGLIGLMALILQTALNGTIHEHKIGMAFQMALPFTALLVVFFAIVAVIEDQHLFTGVIQWVLGISEQLQPNAFYIVSGLLSIISDNVFVATIYINEVKEALDQGMISRGLFDKLAVAINTGTNIPSIGTPNGQAAFLFLLTSPLAPLIQLSYGRMIFMALPYTIIMSITGLIAIFLFI